MHLIARLRWLVARHPSIARLLVVATALITWTSLHRAGNAADTARRRWGEAVTVWITSAAADRGESIAAVATQVPRAIIPDTAVAAGDGPLDAVAARSIARGEILVEGDIAAVDIADAGIIMAVPAETAPQLVIGDRVAVFGSGELLCDGLAITPATQIDGRPVVEVAVPATCAAELSIQLTAGAATLGRRG